MKIAFLEKFSISDEDSSNARLWPVKVKQNPSKVMEMIKLYMENKGYYNIKEYRDYLEINGMIGNASITYHLVNDDNGIVKIGCSVYYPSIGKSRGILYSLLEELDKLFKDYIV